MRETRIRPVSAEDEMRRRYRRDVRRHHQQRKRVTAQVLLALCVLGIVLVFSALTVARHEQTALPKTQFEVAAEQAAAAKAAKPATAAPAATAKKLVAKKPVTAAKKPAAATSAKLAVAPKPASEATKTGLPRVTASAVDVRHVHLGVTASGFVPAEVTVPLGASIILDVDPGRTPDTAGFQIPDLGVEADNSTSTVTIHLGAPGAGTYQYRSYIGGITGTLVVR